LRKSGGKPFHAITNRHLALSAKRTGTKEDKGSTMMLTMWLRRLVKGMSRDEVTSSSEEIKPVALSIVELCLAEGISQFTLFSYKIQLNRKFFGRV